MDIKDKLFNKKDLEKFEKAGVEPLEGPNIWFRCKRCSQKWSPNILSGGRLPKNYWHCPNCDTN